MRLKEQAQILQEKFLKDFWCEDLSFYALALDGNKRPCQVRSSNAGHCLFSGIARSPACGSYRDATALGRFLHGMGGPHDGQLEKRYNPMSYHNGSIWPHDNALIAYGLARYGSTSDAIAILEGIFNASLAMDLHRLPELFCGFKRREDFSPILYPLACAPQAWAAASVYLLLQGCMGFAIDADKKQAPLHLPGASSIPEQVSDKNLVDRQILPSISAEALSEGCDGERVAQGWAGGGDHHQVTLREKEFLPQSGRVFSVKRK